MGPRLSSSVSAILRIFTPSLWVPLVASSLWLASTAHAVTILQLPIAALASTQYDANYGVGNLFDGTPVFGSTQDLG
jgi:hypothetical protein